MTFNPERLSARVKALMTENRAVLNRLESHLGCVACRGPLTNGVCPRCDPEARP